MTQDQQEAEMKAAVLLLGDMDSTLGVDRCRHESITQTALWLFECVQVRPVRGKATAKHVQVGSVNHIETMSSLKWESTRMFGGQACARQNFATMREALAWIDSWDYGRRRAA